MKKYLVVYYGDIPECIEGFPEECKRSCNGALHILPRRARTITADEFEFIKKSYEHMIIKFRIISEMIEKNAESVVQKQVVKDKLKTIKKKRIRKRN